MREAVPKLHAAAVAVGVALLLAGCGGTAEPSATRRAAPTTPLPPVTSTAPATTRPSTAPATTRPSTTPARTTRPAPPPGTTPATDTAAPYPVTVSRVTAAELGATWHSGCPVSPDDLRAVRLGYRGFDGRDHLGTLVVHADAVAGVVHAFGALHAAGFPIRRMEPVSAYGGDDDASMAADNTSAFNCRAATGSTSWSQHAFGRAVDLNPVENPYVRDGHVSPPAGAAYLDRSAGRPGMALAGGVAVRAFATAGWGWGGSWHSLKDYQHFSLTGS